MRAPNFDIAHFPVLMGYNDGRLKLVELRTDTKLKWVEHQAEWVEKCEPVRFI
jgi:hypothetical protein